MTHTGTTGGRGRGRGEARIDTRFRKEKRLARAARSKNTAFAVDRGLRASVAAPHTAAVGARPSGATAQHRDQVLSRRTKECDRDASRRSPLCRNCHPPAGLKNTTATTREACCKHTATGSGDRASEIVPRVLLVLLGTCCCSVRAFHRLTPVSSLRETALRVCAGGVLQRDGHASLSPYLTMIRRVLSTHATYILSTAAARLANRPINALNSVGRVDSADYQINGL